MLTRQTQMWNLNLTPINQSKEIISFSNFLKTSVLTQLTYQSRLPL